MSVTRVGPLAAAIVSIAVVWYVWGQVIPVPVIQDEASYVLQAEIFARGRWTVPSPPLPEFFEQPHVQVVPAVASKYPPGHALLLSLGALVGFPPLMPLLLTGITAALLFGLVARLTNAWVAVLAWLFWLFAPTVLRFQPSYFSEITTTPLVLASWWSLLEWRASRKRAWLVFLALAIGWGAITRPLTMLALAIPIGVIVVRDAARAGLWRDFWLAAAVGVGVLCVLPVWSARTTGDMRLSPLELYRRDYMPFDKLGFTPDTTPPRRAATMSPVLRSVYGSFLGVHHEHQLAVLPYQAVRRVLSLLTGSFQGARLLLLPFALLGLVVATPAFRFGALSALMLFLAYLPYAHWSGYTLYYHEITPVIATLTAFGVWHAARRIAASERRMRLSVVLATAYVAATGLVTVPRFRMEQEARGAVFRNFAKSLRVLPRQPAILFVRYSPRSASHYHLVANSADLDRAPVWVVHDLGPRNAELLRHAPHRATEYFDENALIPE